MFSLCLLIFIIKKKIKCFRPQNVLTDRDYRNYGIFNNLVIKSNKLINKYSGISFPNDKSFKAFKNNKWRINMRLIFIKKFK